MIKVYLTYLFKGKPKLVTIFFTLLCLVGYGFVLHDVILGIPAYYRGALTYITIGITGLLVTYYVGMYFHWNKNVKKK